MLNSAHRWSDNLDCACSVVPRTNPVTIIARETEPREPGHQSPLAIPT